MGSVGILQQCTHVARSFVHNQITKNQHIVNELLAFGEMIGTPQAEVIAETTEPLDGGSRADDEYSERTHSERQIVNRRRYCQTT
jgi:hypothetical protein